MARRNQRVSTIYNLNRTQATLDFVDVDIRTDTKVFISPRALALLPSDWGDGCVALLQNFFETVLEHIKAGRHADAEKLLQSLREPNETHLGLSSGKSRGRALGAMSAHEVWQALSQSKAAKSGLLKDLEDTVLLVQGIGVDIVSDMTTNIIRAPLIEYTQEQCAQLGIPLSEGIDSGPMWHPQRREWFSKHVRLPLTTEGKLMLVPKAIVRRSPLYDMNEYYRHYMLVHMQHIELEARSAFVHMLKDGTPRVYKSRLIEEFGSDKNAVIEQTVQHPEVLERYKREKAAQPFNPLSHEELASLDNTQEPDWDGLLAAVANTPTGTAAASQYERAIEALLTALFYPDLNHPVYQSEIHEGRKRLDIKYTNMAIAGFFAWLSKHYTAPQIFVECKNYGGEIANPELDQLSGRFGRSRGEVGFIVCRQFKNKALFLKRCRDTALDGRGYIIALDDADLATLVAARKADTVGYRQWPSLMKRFNELVA
jgi:hypothetical protein